MGIVKLGLDPGFGNVTAANVNGKVNVVTKPSVVGVGTMDTGALNVAGVTKSRRTDVPTVVGFDGIEYLVGQGVSEHARPIERMDLNRFSDSPELRSLIYATVGQVLPGNKANVALAIGLPVEVLQNKSIAGSIERDMRNWLLGDHSFAIDGDIYSIDIVGLRVDIAQPLASWFNWGLDNTGKWNRPVSDAKAPSLIIDLGFNTLDVIAISSGRISSRYTGGETLGMRRASEMLLDILGRKYGISMSLHEADDLIQAVVNRRSATVYVGGKPVNVDNEAQQSINSLSSLVLRFIDQKVDNATQFNIILTGGGVLALGRDLLTEYPGAVVIDNPLESNAIGLAKLAQREGVF